jgi:hypothetical protein
MLPNKMTVLPVPAAPLYAAPRHAARGGEEAPASPSFLGSLNPLHHIPVVSTVYEKITGTTALPAVRILVASAVAGPLGFMAALADALLEEATGRTAGGHLAAALVSEPETAAIPHGGSGIQLSVRSVSEADRLETRSAGARPTGEAQPGERDPRTPRELARTYLFDLALRHSLNPLDQETGASQS